MAELVAPRASHHSPVAGVAALCASAALLISACSSEPGSTGHSDPLSDLYEQQVTWEDCEDIRSSYELSCGTVTVPVDYEDPAGETIEIALIADDEGADDRPHLLTNPGGPGQAGVDLIASGLSSLASAELRDEYRIVGFDPRGVHRSEGIVCLSDEEFDQEQQRAAADSDEALDSDEEFAAAQQRNEEVAEKCSHRTGDLLEHVDTVSVAKDLDLMRAALGEESLHFVGFSYGTKMGLTYAERFPENVGRFVLDGVLDVSLSSEELTLAQARGFEDALEGFSQWCASTDCPASDDEEEIVTMVQDLFADVQENPRTAADGRTITVSTLITGFITPMYSPEGWPLLGSALSAATERDDFSDFQHFADIQSGRNADGSYEWISTYAHNTIMCLDYPTVSSQEEMDEQSETLINDSPTFGPYFGYDALFCEALEHEASGEPWEPSPDLPGMLLIGTSGDPATPVSWAENVHEMLPDSALLVDDGEGHGAYRPDNTCVAELADEFLLTGELFEGRRDC